MSLRNEDITDREVLYIVNDCEGRDGFATSGTVSEQFGIKDDDRKGRGSVARRLAWMKQYGWLDVQVESGEQRQYRLTKAGKEVMGGKLRASLTKTLENLAPGERVLITRAIASSTFANGTSVEIADAVRREYSHHYAKRPRARARRSR